MTISQEFATSPRSSDPTFLIQNSAGEYLKADFDGTHRMTRDRREATRFHGSTARLWIEKYPAMHTIATGHNRF